VIFEQKERVGGRMVVASHLHDGIWGKGLGRRMHAEDVAGASLIGEGVVRERARALGIEWKQGEKEKGGKEVGFFDGREFVSKTTRPVGEMGWGMWLSLVLRYKLSFLKAKNLPKETMKDFERLLNRKGKFESVDEMVEAVGLGGAVDKTAVEKLRSKGIGGRYVDEVLAPQVWRQTGQSVAELSDLAVSMALEREDQVFGGTGGSFEGIMEKFVEGSGVELQLGTTVIGLKREILADGKEGWVLELEGLGNEEKTYEVFDKVILTGPWNTTSFLMGQGREEEEVYYRSLWATFLLSSKELNAEYFGSSNHIPSQVLPIPSANLPSELEGIHEITYIADIFGPDLNTQSVRKLYRILSDHSISNGMFAAFTGDGDGKLESYEGKIDNAYPLMWPGEGKLGSFKVQDGLWHTGIIERIGSSVDLSWVAGENVGRLVAKEVVEKR
jgi:prenylcysteine oxidase/farnesylcysteine lyase